MENKISVHSWLIKAVHPNHTKSTEQAPQCHKNATHAAAQSWLHEAIALSDAGPLHGKDVPRWLLAKGSGPRQAAFIDLPC